MDAGKNFLHFKLDFSGRKQNGKSFLDDGSTRNIFSNLSGDIDDLTHENPSGLL